jgi:hypothetical protein
MIPFYRRNFQFTRQVPGGSARFWLSDFSGESPYAFGMPLPAWFPRKAFIVSCGLRYEGDPSPLVGQFAAAIDHGSIAFLTGDPPWHQSNSDFRQCDRLHSIMSGQYDSTRDFGEPYLLDRDAGDRFWLQLDSNQAGVFSMWVSILVPASVQPTVVTPSGWLPVCDWAEALYWPLGAGEANHSGWGGYTLLNVIDPLGVEFINNANDNLRLTFKAATDAAWPIAKAYVGARVAGTNNAVSLIPLTFGGNVGVTIGAGAVAVSDALGSGIDLSNGLIVKSYSSGTSSVRGLQSQPAWHALFKSGDDAANATSTGYTASTNRAMGLRLIEARFSP